MEDLTPDPTSCGLVVIDEDEFYEAIEAPKFVDLSVPDQPRPEDRSWFCVRIGCDQNHEEVDPDALYRSFKLRVMAARSPNVRFQRALRKQGPRARANCPQSAPAKSAANKDSRLSTVASISEKMAMTKLKHRPISRLRETPSQGTAEVEKLTSKKAWTTPRNKKYQTKLEFFRSAKNQKAPAAMVASENRIVAKALFLHTPKRSSGSSKIPVSHICSEVKKKLNIHSERMPTLHGSSPISSNKCRRSSIITKKAAGVVSLKNSSRSILSEVLQNQVTVTDVKEIHSNLMNPANEESEKSTRKGGKQNLDLHQASNEGSHVTNDDNKENSLLNCQNRNGSSTAATSESKSLQFVTGENQPLEEAKDQNKAFKENKLHGGKIKRTTNPKPFRLRTDERGILREANLERRLQAEIKKEPSSLLKHADGIRIQETKFRDKLTKVREAKLVRNNLQPHKVEGRKEKVITPRSRNRSLKIEPTTLLKIASPAKEGKYPLKSQLFKDKGGFGKFSELKQGVVYAEGNACHKQEKKSTTIPREPKFHRIHIPKSCSKRNAVS